MNIPTKTYPLSILGNLADGSQEPDAPEERCENCRFMRPGDEAIDMGVCRRFPPVSTPDSSNGLEWSQPTVWAFEWCGEWQPVKKP
jgi:hypothetical protein